MYNSVLALPNLNQEFHIEADASSGGIRAVLMHQGYPIAYISKTLSPRNQLLSVYESEMLVILFTVRKGENYLHNQYLVIKTDHRSLKYLMEQSTIVLEYQGCTVVCVLSKI